LEFEKTPAAARSSNAVILGKHINTRIKEKFKRLSHLT